MSQSKPIFQAPVNAIQAARQSNRFGSRAVFEPTELPKPTTCLPGSPDKIYCLTLRMSRGQQLWHPDDVSAFRPLADAGYRRLLTSLQSHRSANGPSIRREATNPPPVVHFVNNVANQRSRARRARQRRQGTA